MTACSAFRCSVGADGAPVLLAPSTHTLQQLAEGDSSRSRLDAARRDAEDKAAALQSSLDKTLRELDIASKVPPPTRTRHRV